MSKNLSNNIIVQRYAKGFINSLDSRNIVHIEDELLNLKKIFLLNFNTSRIKHLNILNYKAQAIIIDDFLQNYKFSNIINKLCMILVHNNRISILPQVIDELMNIILRIKNIEKAEVISVEKLEPQEIENIKLILEDIYKKNIQIENRIDEKILGGLIINVGSEIFDDSLISKFKKLKNSII